MKLSELFRRGRPKEPSTVQSETVAQPVPSAEVIDLDTHPLRYYPKFKGFVAEWNAYAVTDARLALQLSVQTAQLASEREHEKSLAFQDNVNDLRDAQTHQQEVFSAKVDVPKRVKFRPLKRANRDLRIVREKFARHVSIQRVSDAQLASAEASLSHLDGEFALSGDDHRVDFYALERLRNNQAALDKFFLTYCARKGVVGLFQESALFSRNYRFISIVGNYPESEQLTEKECQTKAEKAIRRQMDISDKELSPKKAARS